MRGCTGSLLRATIRSYPRIMEFAASSSFLSISCCSFLPPPRTATPRPTLLVRSMATQKPNSSSTKTLGSKKAPSIIFPLGEEGPIDAPLAASPPIKLLTRVEQLKLLTRAEKAGLLSAAEKLGLTLTAIERWGLLSKAEESGMLSAATDPGTPGALLGLALALLLLGPFCVYVVPEEQPWEVGLQIAVALLCVAGGSAALAASNLVSGLQRSSR